MDTYSTPFNNSNIHESLNFESTMNVCSFHQLDTSKKKQNYSFAPLDLCAILISNTSNMLCTLSIQYSIKHKQAFPLVCNFLV